MDSQQLVFSDENGEGLVGALIALAAASAFQLGLGFLSI